MPKVEHATIVRGTARERYLWFCIGCNCPTCDTSGGFHVYKRDAEQAAAQHRQQCPGSHIDQTRSWRNPP